jgi:proline iminopeptidase
MCQSRSDFWRQAMTNLTIANDAYSAIKPKDAYLFPEIHPNKEGFLAVSSVHKLWHAEYGNSEGVPVISLHGGPGGGCGPRDMRYFDPKFYRIILVDQRGAGRSLPHASIVDNHSKALIEDLEKLRAHLGIERWLVFGGSWGSALSIAYGEAYPENCLGFILRGVFLATKAEYQKLWNGMGDIYPEEFQYYQEYIPEPERSDLMMAYHKRLINPDPRVHLPAARSFCQYDFMCATLFDKSQVSAQLKDEARILALSRIFAHYSVNEFFFEPDQLINNLHRIRHLPCIIAHGRYDIICRLSSAYRLHQNWPQSHFVIVQDAGHASYDPGMVKVLLDATENMKKLCS